MRAFFLIIVVLCVILYVQYYLKYSAQYEILQVGLDKFQLDMLYEKVPIVIYDRVYDISDLLKTIFAYSYMFQKMIEVDAGRVHKNAHKYLVLTSEDPVIIRLINPKYKKEVKTDLNQSNVQFVSVKLKSNQGLIVPALWYYHTDHMNIKGIELDDLISKVVYNLF